MKIRVERILYLATDKHDLVLDCFAGSGTTGAVAHKMGRRWIMIELNDHCHTHIIPRLTKVIDGKDPGGITAAVNWKGEGGFRYCELKPSLLEKNRLGRWVISEKYNPVELAEAMCLHAGYTFNPRQEPWWMHGQASENDFIYVTSTTLEKGRLTMLSGELGEGQSLLVYCGAFRADPKEFPNLTIKKIPKAILNKCEWGRDDYSLKAALKAEAEASNKRSSQKTKDKQQISSGERVRVPLAAMKG